MKTVHIWTQNFYLNCIKYNWELIMDKLIPTAHVHILNIYILYV